MSDGPKSQPDKFKETARELETDDNTDHFKGRLRKLVKGLGKSQKSSKS